MQINIKKQMQNP